MSLSKKIILDILNRHSVVNAEKVTKEILAASKAPKPEQLEAISHPLQQYIKDKLPNVSKMKQQLTGPESALLIKDFDKIAINDILLSMENKADLSKSYTSVNLTVRSWMKNYKPNESRNKTVGSSFFDIHEKIIQGNH